MVGPNLSLLTKFNNPSPTEAGLGEFHEKQMRHLRDKGKVVIIQGEEDYNMFDL